MAIVVYTPIFTLQRVEVSGISYLTREQVLEIGRIHTGEPLFQLQTDAVAQNLMHDLRIESAVVRRACRTASRSRSLSASRSRQSPVTTGTWTSTTMARSSRPTARCTACRSL